MNAAATLGDRFLSFVPMAKALMTWADVSQPSHPCLLLLGGTKPPILMTVTFP